jgi:hypothetical protein
MKKTVSFMLLPLYSPCELDTRLVNPRFILDMAVRKNYSAVKKNLIECIVSRSYDCSILAYELPLINKNVATNSISCKIILLERRIFLSPWAFGAHCSHFSINK